MIPFAALSLPRLSELVWIISRQGAQRVVERLSGKPST
jgi:hypothetical protein